MIEVIGGNLFQWDTGRVAQVNTDADIHEVHFTTNFRRTPSWLFVMDK